MEPVCHSKTCPFKPATYCCQRCRAEVCYCDGDGTVAVCDGCWGDLERAGYSEADMVGEFGNGDHTLRDADYLTGEALAAAMAAAGPS